VSTCDPEAERGTKGVSTCDPEAESGPNVKKQPCRAARG